ncbi:MAG: hypothetical protein ACK2UB_06245, partial [Anaerolineales bacterium]
MRDLAEKAGIDFRPGRHGYPHFFFLDDPAPKNKYARIALRGRHAETFLYWATTNDVYALKPGRAQATHLPLPDGGCEAVLEREAGEFILTVPSPRANTALAWLRALSDGYVHFDEDLARKLPGPVAVDLAGGASALPKTTGPSVDKSRPYYVPPFQAEPGAALPGFSWEPAAEPDVRHTPLHEVHKALGAKMTEFAGWEMPLWYSGMMDEHL